MSGSKNRQFDRQLELIATPSLVQQGFAIFPQRVFRRNIEHESTLTTQVIDFQIGLKRPFIGRFTVNLGVYNKDSMPAEYRSEHRVPIVPDCMADLTQRLGFFHITEQSFIAKLFRYPKSPPHDHWWEQCEDETKMAQTMRSVMDYLSEDGLDWLESRTTKKAFEWAREELERRKAWKRQLTEPNSIRTYEPMPFPGNT